VYQVGTNKGIVLRCTAKQISRYTAELSATQFNVHQN